MSPGSKLKFTCLGVKWEKCDVHFAETFDYGWKVVIDTAVGIYRLSVVRVSSQLIYRTGINSTKIVRDQCEQLCMGPPLCFPTVFTNGEIEFIIGL